MGARYFIHIERLPCLGFRRRVLRCPQGAGFVTLALPTARPRLRVYRVGAADDEEAPLLIFFRDSTNARGSYPAGRFVELIPEGGGRYLVDFNRARNPYCAYSTIFPCPAPWPGNSLATAIAAGERYQPAGLPATP